MLALRRGENVCIGLLSACRKSVATKVAAVQQEQDEVVTYPEIQDLSFRKRKERSKTEWQDEIRDVKTVEEKLIKINMPRYWGYKVVDLGNKYPYNCLPATQHYTRTLFENINNSTESTNEKSDINTKIPTLVDSVRDEVKDGLEYANDFFRHKYPNEAELEPMEKERLFTQLVVEQLNRALKNVLAADCPHLHETEVDYNPRHEGFWYVGGIKPPKNVVKSKENREWQKEMSQDPVDRLMQYTAEPYLTLRHRYQLPTWRESESNDGENASNLTKKLPHYEYDPRTLGYSTSYRHGTNIPGYWPGSASGFGLVSYQSRAHLLVRPKSNDVEDIEHALHAQAIQSSFSWLLAQANYNGFNTFSDLTYPMNTQTIITNGRTWSFYEYQLHTLLIHGNHVYDNSRVNFCRGTNEMNLYEHFDENGKCIGFNDNVLNYLVQFYANAPIVQRSAAELQPYLSEEYKHIADYADEEKRTFLEHTYKHMVANRERHLARPEIYLWEKIYKIDNKTRQMEPKRRFFELDINPWQRTLDQHQKVYIPRALRPEGTKSKKKWRPTYYP